MTLKLLLEEIKGWLMKRLVNPPRAHTDRMVAVAKRTFSGLLFDEEAVMKPSKGSAIAPTTIDSRCRGH